MIAVLALAAATLAAQVPPDLVRALEAAAQADERLRDDGTCKPEDVEVIRSAARATIVLLPDAKPAVRWRFPIDRVKPALSIGGHDGNGFIKPAAIRCYAAKATGHAAHDLFVPDVHPTGHDAQGGVWHALAVEDGVVLVTHTGWQPGDPLKGGNYVMLYLPARRQVAYYAHLDSVTVQPGQRVARGEILGVVGRTGRNAQKPRSPTHLHFGLWDAETLEVVNPYAQLVDAEGDPSTNPP